MAITSDDTEIPTTAIVAVRVPRNSGVDLATDAERRLSHIDGVQAVAIDRLCGIEPELSATIVTVTVTICGTVPIAELRDRLAASTSVEAIERLDSG